MPGLSSPLRVGSLTLKNRILMPPMATGLADERGYVTPELIAHYQLRAGGPAAITVEHSYVAPEGRRTARQINIAEDGAIPGLRRLAAAIQKGGSLALVQITHGGSRCPRALTGRPPAGPSEIQVPGDGEDPRPMTPDEIRAVPPLFAAATVRAMEAGFDGVQIHGAHGFLLSEFMSPVTNRRTDEYGGSLGGRIKLVREVVVAVRAVLRPNTVLSFRFPVEDGVEGGLRPADAAEIATLLPDWGVDLLDCSGGLCGSRPPGRVGQGYFLEAAAVVKASVRVPVAAVGGISDPVLADKAITDNLVDAVSVGRAQLKDPKWAEKALAAISG